jgi:hypothetical protein
MFREPADARSRRTEVLRVLERTMPRLETETRLRWTTTRWGAGRATWDRMARTARGSRTAGRSTDRTTGRSRGRAACRAKPAGRRETGATGRIRVAGRAVTALRGIARETRSALATRFSSPSRTGAGSNPTPNRSSRSRFRSGSCSSSCRFWISAPSGCPARSGVTGRVWSGVLTASVPCSAWSSAGVMTASASAPAVSTRRVDEPCSVASEIGPGHSRESHPNAADAACHVYAAVEGGQWEPGQPCLFRGPCQHNIESAGA